VTQIAMMPARTWKPFTSRLASRAGDDRGPRDTNAAQDVFVRDRRRGATTRVSISSTGRQGRQESYWPSINASGRYVAFATRAPNLVPGDTNDAWDIVVHDRRSGVTRMVSVALTAGQPTASRYCRASATTAPSSPSKPPPPTSSTPTPMRRTMSWSRRSPREDRRHSSDVGGALGAALIRIWFVAPVALGARRVL
jgi:hypothetical protein